LVRENYCFSCRSIYSFSSSCCGFFFSRRDATNPTFRKIALKDVDFSHKENRNKMKLEDGAFFIDVTSQLNM
jgi:hypothetical protein